MAPLRCAAKFDPFLSLDCAPTPSTLAQSKERNGSNFAIWQPCLRAAPFHATEAPTNLPLEALCARLRGGLQTVIGAAKARPSLFSTSSSSVAPVDPSRDVASTISRVFVKLSYIYMYHVVALAPFKSFCLWILFQ